MNTCVPTRKEVWKNVNPDENPGVGSIPLKSIVIFKQPNRPLNCWIRTDSRSGSEFAVINSTVKSYMYPVNRTPTDDHIQGGNGPR